MPTHKFMIIIDYDICLEITLMLRHSSNETKLALSLIRNDYKFSIDICIYIYSYYNIYIPLLNPDIYKLFKLANEVFILHKKKSSIFY